MDRFGVYPGYRDGNEIQKEVQKDITDVSGKVRVNKKKCSSCPFTPNSSFNYQLKRIVRELDANPTFLMQCHSTYPSDVQGAACRGGYDYAKIRIKNPQFVEQRKGNYIVTPFGE